MKPDTYAYEPLFAAQPLARSQHGTRRFIRLWTIGKRVELNALTSSQLVALVEAGLIARGVGKVVPAAETLAETYAVFRRGAIARRALEAERARLNGATIETPEDLEQRVHDHLAAHPAETWDATIRAVGGS